MNSFTQTKLSLIKRDNLQTVELVTLVKDAALFILHVQKALMKTAILYTLKKL